jgi:hypothetical protein
MSQAIQNGLERTLDADEIGIQVGAYLRSQQIANAWAGMAEHGTERAVGERTMFPVFSGTSASRRSRCIFRPSGGCSSSFSGRKRHRGIHTMLGTTR